jgi:hypothetical protein
MRHLSQRESAAPPKGKRDGEFFGSVSSKLIVEAFLS